MSDTVAFRRTAGSSSTSRESPSENAIAFASSVVTVTRPEGIEAEAIRSLRTHIISQHLNLGRRALAICAATADAGSSFVAANLAVALSQAGLSTVLVDANLVRPRIDTLIRPPIAPAGLAAHLASDTPYEDCIDARVLNGLSVIYAGRDAADSQELLAGVRFRGLMDFCLRNFDATIVDTPPASISYGAKQVSAVVGYSLLVACKDKTFVKDVKTLGSELKADGVTIVGSVLCGA